MPRAFTRYIPNVQIIFEKTPNALMSRIKIVVGVSVIWLKERDRTEEFASRFQHPANLLGANKWVANVLEDGNGHNGVEGIIFERKPFADADDIGGVVIDDLIINNVVKILGTTTTAAI